MNIKPRVSVITICYNAVNTLEETIISVINQDYQNLEYIVIDGGSKDGTVDVIQKYSEFISLWVSEKDDGIFDAMNKGYRSSRGEWIIYVNSGDKFYDNKSLSNLLKLHDISAFDVVYGDSIAITKDKEELYHRASNGIPLFREIPSFRHGASVMKKTSMPNPPFATEKKEFGFALDANLIFNMVVEKRKFCHVHATILKYEKEGVSDNQFEGAKYNYRIYSQYGFRLIPFLQYLKSYSFQYLKKLIKK